MCGFVSLGDVDESHLKKATEKLNIEDLMKQTIILIKIKKFL